MNTRFTIEEENIVAIYAEDSRETTLENILAAMPYMDEDMRQLAAAAVNKLQAMTDSEFSEREFILNDRKTKLYEDYRQAKKQMQEYGVVKKNVDSILYPSQSRAREQER